MFDAFNMQFEFLGSMSDFPAYLPPWCETWYYCQLGSNIWTNQIFMMEEVLDRVCSYSSLMNFATSEE